MTTIQNTVYAENFPPEAVTEVFSLDEMESAAVFEPALGKGVGGFFNLPDTHWLVEVDMRAIGRWFEAYNANDTKSVELLLKEAVDWTPNDEVYYIIKKSIVLKTHWGGFTAWWEGFLACEDDATILVRNPKKKEALVFTSLGEIRHVVG